MGKTIMAGMAGRRGRALRHRVAAAAGFLFLLVSGVTGAWAAVGDFAGTYSGTYTGSDNGTWTMRCEPDGAMIGVAWSTAHDLPMAAGEGLITAAGAFSLKMEAEGQILTVMSGNISAGGSVAGTWNNPYTGDKGQLSGRRDLPAELAVFAGAYAGTYAGPDSGTWAGSADAAGNLLGSVTSALTHQTHSMEGIINRSGEFVAASSSGAVQHGTIHKTTGAVQGTWVLPDDTRGTLTGGRAAQPQKPAVVTLAAAGVTAGAATLNGTVNPNGSDAAYLFQYGPTAAYGWQTAALSAGAGTAAVPVSAAVAGLAPGTPYHFRLEATNAAGTTYGNGLAFTTAAVAPTVVTLAPSPLGPDRAAGGGTVVADGGAAVTARGVCWGPAENPTVADSKTVDGSGLGGFSSLVTGLTPGVPYHVRAYATNGAGTAYGDDHAFSTQAQAPGVVTGAASALTETSALLRATVNPNGDPTDWHFEYGETDAYGLTTPEEDAGGGTAPVAVSAAVEGLPPGSACHYRVVAVNGLGTSYGADRVLSTEILYVAPGGQCGGKSPCYISIQAALDAAGDGAAIRVASGEYAENLAPGEAKTLTLSGGWDAAFDAAAGLTVVDGGSLPPLTLESGALAVERLVLR